MKRERLLSAYFFPTFHQLVRTRIAICCSFFIQGFSYATWCSRIPDLQRLHQLNDAQLGTLLLALPVGEFISLIPCAELIRRFGSRRMLILAGFGYPLILLLLATLQQVWLLAPTLLLMGFVANLSNTAANTQAVRLEHLYRRSIITLFHGMWSFAGLVAVVVAMLLARFNTTLLMHMALVFIGLWSLLSFSGGALLMRDRPTPSTATKSRFADWKLSPFILWVGLAALGCMVCEGAIYNWSGVYLRDVLSAKSSQMSAGYFAYMCTMVPLRFVIDRWITRWGIQRILVLSAMAIIGGFLCVTLGTFPLALLGFAGIGCGTSAVVPICCSLAGKCKSIAPSIAIAEVSMIGFLGFLIMPPLIGFIAHLSGLRTAFALMTLFGGLILLATSKIRRYH